MIRKKKENRDRGGNSRKGNTEATQKKGKSKKKEGKEREWVDGEREERGSPQLKWKERGRERH